MANRESTHGLAARTVNRPTILVGIVADFKRLAVRNS
jgi:hypothetical protein